MRFVRLLGAVVIFYGLSYFLHALLQILSTIRFGGPGVLAQIIISINLAIGLAALINGIGLLLTQKWSRVSWLVTVTALLLFHNFILVLTHWLGQDLTQQLLNVGLIFFLAVISWAKLGDEEGKKYFP